MKGHRHDRRGRRVRLALVGGMLLISLAATAGSTTAAPGGTGAKLSDVAALPGCEAVPPDPAGPGVVAEPWQTILDEDGVVIGHRMTIRREGLDIPIHAGRRGFGLSLGDDRMLLGERSDAGTVLTMLDPTRACRLWQRALPQLTYDVEPEPGSRHIRLAIHEPRTRLFEGLLILDLDTGATEAMIDGECSTSCEPNDGEVPPAAYVPAGPPRPVPVFSAGAWPRDHALPFSWQSGALPPSWARTPIQNAAQDARETSRARSPIFEHRAAADETVRYTGTFPTFCRYGIACASRSMPAFWAVWIRPHGTDFSWGTLRWCQKSSGDGCFDLRRVMLHELGHVAGLNHPSSAGFTLGPDETVMQAISPARPSAGSNRHAFGRCDVASLQELYDVPSRSTRISTCNDVYTDLSLDASASSVTDGASVRLTATLRIADRDGYGLLARNGLDGRSVKLKYRRAGSDDPWSTAWMEPRSGAGRYELTIAPQSTWEFEATFPAPDDEGLRFSRSETVKVKVMK